VSHLHGHGDRELLLTLFSEGLLASINKGSVSPYLTEEGHDCLGEASTSGNSDTVINIHQTIQVFQLLNV
jgi:hypothetical protein